MTALAQINGSDVSAVVLTLPALVDRAVKALSSARTSAEVLEARDRAGIAYDVAKKTARLAKAKNAHDSLVAAAHRSQADALEIEAQAKRRLADEYDSAQERGEVGQSGARTDLVSKDNEVTPSASDVGLSREQIHEARNIRDAENADPGVVRRVLDQALADGEEPTKAKVRRAVNEVVHPEEAPTESTPNTRFLNVAWDAEHRPTEFDFTSMTNLSELADAAQRVAAAWTTAAEELRRLAGDEQTA